MQWRRLIELRIQSDGWIFSPIFWADYCRLSYREPHGVTGIIVAQSENIFPIQLLNSQSAQVKAKGEADVIQLSPSPFTLPCLALKAIPSDRRKGSKFVHVLIEVSMPLTNPSSQPASTSSTANPTSVAAIVTTVVLLAANSSRKGGTIWNNSSANLFIELGATASATTFTARVDPGGYYEIPFSYTGTIAGIWSAANGNALVRELV